MAGAQVRAIAAALDEGELDALRATTRRARVIWVAGRGNGRDAPGAMLAATLGGVGRARRSSSVAEAPPWIGAA